MPAVVHTYCAELDRGRLVSPAATAKLRSPVETIEGEKRHFYKAINGDFFIARGEAELGDSLPLAMAKNRIWYVSALNREARLVHISTDLHRIIKAERERLAGASSSCLYRVIGIHDKNAMSQAACHKKYDPAAADREIGCLLKLLDNVTDNVLDLSLKNENLDENSRMHIESILKLFVIDSVTYLLNDSEGDDAALALSGMPAKHARDIINAIQLNYMDPELSPKKVARKLSITVRYVHALLHQSGKSFSERVQELRLTAAYRMLNSAQFSARNIGEIAYQVGFSDQSHFNRCFKKRFDASPREIRRQARGKVELHIPSASLRASREWGDLRQG